MNHFTKCSTHLISIDFPNFYFDELILGFGTRDFEFVEGKCFGFGLIVDYALHSSLFPFIEWHFAFLRSQSSPVVV